MVDEIKVYISAAAELERERDLLGRLIAKIPVTLGWRIVHTPPRGEPVDTNAIETADIHILILGGDIRAPIGYEWLSARRSGRSTWLFLKQGIFHTTAALDFMHRVGALNEWKQYKFSGELRKMVEHRIAEHILTRASLYTIQGQELENLIQWKKGLDKKAEDDQEDHKRGAGDSGIIISPERYVPRDGVLIIPPEEADSG